MKTLILLLLSPVLLLAQSPNIKLNLIASGFGSIVDIVTVGDNRMFLVGGNHVKILINGQTNPTSFLNLSDRAS